MELSKPSSDTGASERDHIIAELEASGWLSPGKALAAQGAVLENAIHAVCKHCSRNDTHLELTAGGAVHRFKEGGLIACLANPIRALSPNATAALREYMQPLVNGLAKAHSSCHADVLRVIMQAIEDTPDEMGGKEALRCLYTTINDVGVEDIGNEKEARALLSRYGGKR